MIQRLSHITVHVLDQAKALAFYTEKLGFEVRTDEAMGAFRWLTVGPKGQPDLEIVLMPLNPSPFRNEEDTTALRRILSNSGLGGGVLETADCQKTYEELKAKGVEFVSEPTERPYGIEALFKDDSGNWYSMVQRPQK
jgi:catechol 2,3-dioxygenase-like lactoylglutathione lyase family enzyme